MRLAVTALLVSGAVALIAFPASARAQAPSATTYPATMSLRPAPAADPRVQAAAVVAKPTRPVSAGLPSAPRVVAAKPSVVQPSTYWGPAKPAPSKKKPSALRRFFNRFGGGEDENYDPEQGVKVTRDLATGRTNVLDSKPWMSKAP